MLFREKLPPAKSVGREYNHPLLLSAAQTLSERLQWFSNPFHFPLVTGPYAHLIESAKFANPATYSLDLPKDQSKQYDCILSFFALQVINDVPGYLKQIETMLLPGGFFSAVFLGGESFLTLKNYLMNTEFDLTQGFALRVHPSIHIADALSLLANAGFACPLADLDSHTLNYPSAYALIQDLRKLQATSCLQEITPLKRRVADKIMHDKEPLHDTASFVFLTGLKKGVQPSLSPDVRLRMR